MADEKAPKRKRFSKNKKKYWKKHSDVQDVEEFLEDQRLQERTGGLVAEKADEQLFFVDTSIQTKDKVKAVQKKRRRGAKPLKCHSALLPDPHIKPIRVQHNIKKVKPKKPDSGPVKVSKSVQARQAMRKEAQVQRDARHGKKLVPVVDHDLWTSTASQEGVDKHYLRSTKKLPKMPPPLYYDKPSGRPAVEVVHPGASYNPTYEDHQELLSTALEVEVQKEKAEMKIQRALDEVFPSKAPTEADRHRELAEGLFGESDSESESGEGEEGDLLSVNPPIRREDKKTEKQRSKEKKVREELEKSQKDKTEKIKKSEVFRIKTRKKEVDALLTRQGERRKRKAERAEAEKDKPKKLGRNRYEAPDIEIKLSGEIQGSLRLLKPEGHLLEDRFKSLQRRNMLESRGRASNKRKYKLKKYVKKSHKEAT